MTHPAADTTAVTPHGPSFPCTLREFPVDSTETTTSWVLETLEADCALVSPLIKAQAAQQGECCCSPGWLFLLAQSLRSRQVPVLLWGRAAHLLLPHVYLVGAHAERSPRERQEGQACASGPAPCGTKCWQSSLARVLFSRDSVFCSTL